MNADACNALVLMILHYHRHNKTPVWAHNHDLFDEHRHLVKLKEISQNHGTKYSSWLTEDNYTNI